MESLRTVNKQFQHGVVNIFFRPLAFAEQFRFRIRKSDDIDFAFDTVPDSVRHSPLDHRYMRGDKQIPEAEEMVGEDIHTLAGGMLSGGKIFPENPQIDQIFEAYSTGARFKPNLRGDFAQSDRTVGDGLDDCIVIRRIAYFLFEEVYRFFEKVCRGLEKSLGDVSSQAMAIVELFQIQGDSPRHAIYDGDIPGRKPGKKARRFAIIKRLYLELGSPPAIEGALITQYLVFHEGH